MIGDVELVHAAQAGDVAALGTLLERSPGTAVCLCARHAGGPGTGPGRGAGRVPGRIAAAWGPAGAGGRWRVAARHRPQRLPHAPAGLPRAAWRDLGSGRGMRRCEVDEALEQSALRNWLWTTLEELPDDLRATVMLRYFTRHTTYSEIAAILGIPVGTVRSRLNQAKRRLADALLASAMAAHRDHGALVEQRVHWWRAVVDEVEQEGTAALYIADAVPDTLVEAPAMGYRAYGVEDHARSMVETRRGRGARASDRHGDERRRHDRGGKLRKPARRSPPLSSHPHGSPLPSQGPSDAHHPLLRVCGRQRVDRSARSLASQDPRLLPERET